MGAAGNVTVYDLAEIQMHYRTTHPEHDLLADWWYLKTGLDDLEDKAGSPALVCKIGQSILVFDYADDQGWHEGSGNSFWFTDEEAQQRVLTVLAKCNTYMVEVWT